MIRQGHICFFSGKRGGFTHLIPIFEKIKQTDNMYYSIVVADMHLSEKFGKTVGEVAKWSDNIYQVETISNSDSKVERAKSIGIGIMKFAPLLEKVRPDIVFVLGDRGEVLAFTIAAMELNIPIVHLFGGDVTQGGVDEPVRHAITKLSNIHLASNQKSADRIVKMGEEKWRVHNVGSPVIDLIFKKRFASPEIIKSKYELDLEKPILLFLQHSVTWQVEEAENQMRQSMDAIDQLGYQTVAVYPCSDPGYESIIRVLLEYQDKPYFQLHKNIEFADFWGLMNVADVFIGNSSAGVMETAPFKLPFINIGIRQEGRLRSDNVIDVEHDKKNIMEAIQTAIFDKDFIETVERCKSPYGDGHASERIVSILRELEINEKLIRKKVTY